MKRKLGILLLVACLAVCMTSVAACSKTPIDEGNAVNVYVIGGEGGGKYIEGTNCRLVAQVPEGKQFMYWEADGERLSSSAEFVFTVTEDVTVFAVYADSVANAGKKVFTVDIPKLQEAGVVSQPNVAALGAGGYFEGDKCTVSLRASDTERTFTGWAAVNADGTQGEILSADKSYTFTVTSNVVLMPVFPYGYVKLATPGTKSFQISGNTWEFDRNDNGTVFIDKGGTTKYLKFRVYDNENATGAPVGEFNLEHKYDPLPDDYEFGKYEHTWFRSDITTNDGTVLFMAMAQAGNIYYPGGSKDKMKEVFGRVIENFDYDTTYYVTAQLCGPTEPVTVNGVLCEILPSEHSDICLARIKVND